MSLTVDDQRGRRRNPVRAGDAPTVTLDRGQLEPDANADAPLLARLRAGDELAYEELVRQHSPRLLAVARRLLRNDEDARDALQQAFLSAFRGLSTFEGHCRLGTWLHRIVVN